MFGLIWPLPWQVHSLLKSPHIATFSSKQTASSDVQDSTIGHIFHCRQSPERISRKTKKFSQLSNRLHTYAVISILQSTLLVFVVLQSTSYIY